ncbi:MAG TPA: Ig-like domain-containing protein, partial [Gemmatimonadaceae bacterium]|nr:Ig-like domain-containing protein [Gemmatimonadaceae bacterium]
MLGAIVSAAACSDRGPASPTGLQSVAPGHAAFTLAPRFAAMPDGGPSIELSTVTGVLIDAEGNKISITAHFQGDSAVLDFDVPIQGSSANFTLNISAFDANGVLAYTVSQPITLKAGLNNNLPAPVLVYAAPDAAVTALTVSPSTLTLSSGTTGGVTATGTNAGGQAVAPLRVGWTSRNAAVATVDADGTVHAGSFQGTTYIVGRLANNVADSAQVKVHAPVAKVVVNPTSAQVVRGQTSTIVGQLFDAGNNLIDDRTAAWTTSDPTIATVSAAGVVTGVKIGTATITATAENHTASVAVTVVTPLDHVQLAPGSVNLASLHQSIALTTTLVPKTGASIDGITPTYAASDSTIATVDAKGVVTAVANGTATITVTADALT